MRLLERAIVLSLVTVIAVRVGLALVRWELADRMDRWG